jgi:hypothetical protein
MRSSPSESATLFDEKCLNCFALPSDGRLDRHRNQTAHCPLASSISRQLCSSLDLSDHETFRPNGGCCYRPTQAHRLLVSVRNVCQERGLADAIARPRDSAIACRSLQHLVRFTHRRPGSTAQSNSLPRQRLLFHPLNLQL